MADTIKQQRAKIINEALGRIGSAPIMATDEDTVLAGQVVPIYTARVATILSQTDWAFARKTFKLDQIAPTVESGYVPGDGKFQNGWRYAFSLPGDRLSEPRRVLVDPRRPDDPLRTFHLEEGNLYADRHPLWATFTVNVAPEVWPPLFREAVVLCLAAAFAVPVAHDTRLAGELSVFAEGPPEEQGRGGLLGRALGTNSAGAPMQAPQWRDPLTEARFS